METAGVALIAQGSSAYIGDLKSATGATNAFVSATEKGSTRVSAAGQVMIGGLREIGKTTVDVFGKALKATAAFVGEGIDLAGDFEARMKEFRVAAGKDIDTAGLEKFHDLFLQIGKDLPVSTSDVQQAAIELVKGGIDPATVAAGGLKQAIQFASAAMKGDLVGAAEISSKIVAGWANVNATAADKADLLTHATDLFTKAANASSTNVEQLSQGIFNAQGIAKTAGVSLDDLTTTIAELSGDFSSSAEAGTSLKNMIARLQPTTKPATAAMMDLGLYTDEAGSAFYDAQGNFVGFQQASELLQQSLVGLTKEQQASALQTIFGNDAMSAAAGLAARGGEGYQVMADSLKNAMGVAEAGATQQEGYNTALENTKGSVEAFQIQLNEHLLPVLTTLFNDYITPGINTLSSFTDSFLKMVPAIAASDDPLQTFLNALKVAAPGMLDTITKVEGFKDAVVGFATPILDKAIPALTTLYDWLKVKIPEAAKATADFWSTTLQPALAKVEDFLVIDVFPALSTAADWLKTTIPAAAKATADFWNDSLWPALKKINDYINTTIFPTFKDLSEKYLVGITKSSDDMATSWNTTLYPALTKIAEYTQLSLNKELSELNVWWATIQKTGEIFAAFWNNVLWPGLVKVGDYLSLHLTQFFKDFNAELNTQVGPTLKGIVDWFSKLGGGMDGIGKQLQDTTKYFNDLSTQIREMKLPAWLQPGSPTPLEIGLIGIGNAMAKSVLPNLLPFQQGMREIGSAITDTFQNTDIIDALTSLGEDAMAGFGAGIRDGFRSVENIIESTASSVEDAFNDAFESGSPSKRMEPVGAFVVQGMMVGMQSQMEALKNVVSDLGDDLVSQAADIASQVQDAISDAFGATASVNRQKISNLSKLADVAERLKGGVQFQLEDAEKVALGISDPQQAAAWFKQRSNQIFELADITSKLDRDLTDQQRRGLEDNLKKYEQDLALLGKEDDDSTQEAAQRAHIMMRMAEAQASLDNDLTDAARQMLIDKYQLVNAAQNAETAQTKNTQAQGSPTQDLIDQIQAFLLSNQKDLPGLLEDPVIKALYAYLDQYRNAPKRADGGPVKSGQPYWIGEDGPELFWPQMNGSVSPAASSQQLAARASNNQSYDYSRHFPMTVMTNNSPAVVQQSWAIAQASMA